MSVSKLRTQIIVTINEVTDDGSMALAVEEVRRINDSLELIDRAACGLPADAV